MMWLVCRLIFFSAILFPQQSFEKYIVMLEEGQIAEVRNKIDVLKTKYPDSPTVMYLQAMVTMDGESSLTQFQSFVRSYPDNQYADDAEMKIGEYLFSRGLYSQAGRQLEKIPNKYKNSNHLKRAIDLLIKSFEATGERDSAKIYANKYKDHFPELEINHYAVDGQSSDIKLKNSATHKFEKTVAKTKPKTKPFVVQLGAFGKYDNAKRLQSIVLSSGYTIAIEEVKSNGKRLHVVRMVRFSTEDEAKKAGQFIKANYGINYRVLNRPGK